jgi:hypothetical protein
VLPASQCLPCPVVPPLPCGPSPALKLVGVRTWSPDTVPRVTAPGRCFHVCHGTWSLLPCVSRWQIESNWVLAGGNQTILRCGWSLSLTLRCLACVDVFFAVCVCGFLDSLLRTRASRPPHPPASPLTHTSCGPAVLSKLCPATCLAWAATAATPSLPTTMWKTLVGS